jgi:NADPH:quinone reductase-like Zn-dependent oxidoreductase
MKAVIWTAYGSPDVLQLREIGKPVPKDDEVLIKIYATTVTAGDCEVRSLSFQGPLALIMRLYVGLLRPKRIKILGQELSGVIEEAGKDVTRFQIGDEVFAGTGFTMGGNAEYICLSERYKDGEHILTHKPSNMTHAQAAALPTGGLEALSYLRRAEIQAGETIAIIGAGGSIGTIAIQLAKDRGAVVTCIDSAEKLEMLTSIGADYVIDYRSEDFTKNGKTYDVIFDIVGKNKLSRFLPSLAENGRYLLANPSTGQLLRGSRIDTKSGKKMVFRTAERTPEDLLYLKRLVEEGKLRTIVDRSFPLTEIAQAHDYVESGRKAGNVIISVTEPAETS